MMIFFQAEFLVADIDEDRAALVEKEHFRLADLNPWISKVSQGLNACRGQFSPRDSIQILEMEIRDFFCDVLRCD